MSYDPMFPTTKGILRKLGGDKISGKVLTWDGDKSNEIELPDGTFIKRIADFVDMTKVESVTAEASYAGIITFSKSQLTVNTAGDGDFNQYTLFASDVPMLLSFNVELEGVEAGTYVISTGTGFRFISATTSVTVSETIVPIDPKFLPGVCLPVVEIAFQIGADGRNLTAEEATLMDALNGGVCIFKLVSEAITAMAVTAVAHTEGAYLYVLSAAGFNYEVTNMNGTWVIKHTGS